MNVSGKARAQIQMFDIMVMPPSPKTVQVFQENGLPYGLHLATMVPPSMFMPQT